MGSSLGIDELSRDSKTVVRMPRRASWLVAHIIADLTTFSSGRRPRRRRAVLKPRLSANGDAGRCGARELERPHPMRLVVDKLSMIKGRETFMGTLMMARGQVSVR